MRDEYVIMLYGDGMKLETNLKQTQIQTQKLSLKQQFSLKVLEMNDTQVLDAIVAELEIQRAVLGSQRKHLCDAGARLWRSHTF